MLRQFVNARGNIDILGFPKDFLANQRRIFRGETLAKISMLILVGMIFISVFAPVFAPYGPQERQRADDGGLERLSSPSADHLLGTTEFGYDVFSMLVYGSRVSLFVGLLAAVLSITIGTTVGVVSAYYGGRVDTVLMRITDIVYSVPFIPFIFLLVLFMGPSTQNIAIAIALVLWRASARVIRSQTLTIKERPFIESAEAIGASNFRVMYKHILPNVSPLVFLYGAFAISAAILAEAGVSFLGMGDPDSVSWGQIIYTAYQNGAFESAPWWIIPPGVCITIVVVSVFMIARVYEKVSNPDLDKEYVQ